MKYYVKRLFVLIFFLSIGAGAFSNETMQTTNSQTIKKEEKILANNIKKSQKYSNNAYKDLNSDKILKIRFTKGVAGLKEFDFSSIFDDISKSIEFNPKNDMAYALKAEVLRCKGETKLAEDLAKQSLIINPKNAYAKFVLGSLYVGVNDTLALDYLSKSVALDSSNPLAYINKASAEYNLKKYDEVIKSVDKSFNLYQKNIYGHSLKARSFFILKKYNEAIAEYTILIKQNDKDEQLFYNRALAYANLKRFSEATADINTRVKLQPKFSGAYIDRLVIYSITKPQKKYIIKDINSVLKYISTYPMTEENLERLILVFNEYSNDSKSLYYAEKLLNINPQNKVAIKTLTSLYMQNGQYDKAYNLLKDCDLAKDIKAPEYYNLFISALSCKNMSVEQISVAVTNLTKYLELHPNDTKLYLYRGSAYIELGQYQKGLADFNKYTDIKKDIPLEFLFQRARAKYYLKQYTSSLNDYITLFKTDVESRKYSLFNMLNIVNNHDKDIDYNRVSDVDSDIVRNVLVRLISEIESKNFNVKICDNSYFPIVSPIASATCSGVLPNNSSPVVKQNIYYYAISEGYNVRDNFINLGNSLIGDNSSKKLMYLQKSFICTDDTFIYGLMLNTLTNYEFRKGLNQNEIKAANSLANKCYVSLANHSETMSDMIYYLERAMNYGYSKFNAYMSIADTYKYDVKDNFKATQYYTKALAIKSDAKAYAKRGDTKAAMRDYSGALNDYTKALSLNKSLDDVYFNRGQIYFDRKQFSKAFEDYKKYSMYNKSSAAAVYNMGACLFNQNRKKEAYGYYQRAKNLYQNNGDRDGYNSCIRAMNRINGY